jgi:hypothetical protein
MARDPITMAITTPTTAAVVTCGNPRFENSVGIEDPELVTMDMAIKFNGITGELGDAVTFARNATQTEKQAAVRLRLNDLLASVEGGIRLNNANIQISGLPV